MTRTHRRDRVIFSLAALAFLQLMLLGARLGEEMGGSSSWLKTGDRLADTQFRGPSGDGARGALHAPAVLLVFDPGCDHCLAVAPVWAEWLSEVGAGWHVVAVASAPGEAARSFIRAQGWDLELAVTASSPRRSSTRGLTGRTPWVFVVDEAGLIVAHGPGRQIAEITGEAALALAREPWP